MSISKELLDILVCPVCKHRFHLLPDESGLKCAGVQARLSGARRYSGDAAGRSHDRAGIIFATEKRRMSTDFANSIPRLKRLLPRFRKIAHRRARRSHAGSLSLGQA